MNELFAQDGGLQSLDARLHAWAEPCNAEVVDGAAMLEGLRGYSYKEPYGWSMLELAQAHAIRMNGTDFLTWRTAPPPASSRTHAVFVFEMAMGNGCAYPQPTGRFDLNLNGSRLLSFTLSSYAQLWSGDQAQFYFDLRRKRGKPFGAALFLDEWIQSESLAVNGIGFLRVHRDLLNGCEPVMLSIAPQSSEPSRNWFRLGFVCCIRSADLRAGLKALARGRAPRSIAGHNVYFGDLHAHSNQSTFLDNWGCGSGSLDDNFRYARDTANLDFFCMSDHDFQLNAHDWKTLMDTTDAYNQDGRFAAIKGYEWTNMAYGHRNVYFKDTRVPEILDAVREKAPVRYGNSRSGFRTPAELWAWLDRLGDQAMTVPHHPNTAQFLMDLDAWFNQQYDRLVEVYSVWGASDDRDLDVTCNNDRFVDYAINRYLDRLAFGLIASSDGHDGHPGQSGICRKRKQMGHGLGSGKAAVYAEALSRDHIFDALYARQCYAVTGAPILLHVQRVGTPPRFIMHAQGTDLVQTVRVTRNNRTVLEQAPATASVCLEWMDEEAGADTRCLVKLIQCDGEMAWIVA